MKAKSCELGTHVPKRASNLKAKGGPVLSPGKLRYACCVLELKKFHFREKERCNYGRGDSFLTDWLLQLMLPSLCQLPNAQLHDRVLFLFNYFLSFLFFDKHRMHWFNSIILRLHCLFSPSPFNWILERKGKKKKRQRWAAEAAALCVCVSNLVGLVWENGLFYYDHPIISLPPTTYRFYCANLLVNKIKWSRIFKFNPPLKNLHLVQFRYRLRCSSSSWLD